MVYLTFPTMCMHLSILPGKNTGKHASDLYWHILLKWKCNTASLFSFTQSFALFAETKSEQTMQVAFMQANTSQYGCCHLEKITSFGARVCAVEIRLEPNSVQKRFVWSQSLRNSVARWSRGIRLPPKLPQTQSAITTRPVFIASNY